MSWSSNAAFPAPDKTQQPERLCPPTRTGATSAALPPSCVLKTARIANGSCESDKLQRFAVAEQLAQRGKRLETDRFIVLLDHPQHLAELYALGGFERRKRNPLPVLVEHAERTVIGTDEADRTLDDASTRPR